MYWISRYLDPWPWPIFHAPVTYTFYVNVPLSLGCMIRKVSAEDIAIRGNGTGLEYMFPTRHFVYIFFNPVFRLSTTKNEINLFNNHVLIVAPVTFAPAGAMTPSAEFLSLIQVGQSFKCLVHQVIQSLADSTRILYWRKWKSFTIRNDQANDGQESIFYMTTPPLIIVRLLSFFFAS